MNTERTNSAFSIPHVRALIGMRMAKHAVIIQEFGLALVKGATPEQAAAAMRELVDGEKESSVAWRFSIGDLYNDIPKGFGNKRRWVFSAFPRDSEARYRLFRQYGWVARKWPAPLRRDDRPWEFYVRCKPGSRSPNKRKDTLIRLEVRSERSLDDGGRIFTAEHAGRFYELPVPAASDHTKYSYDETERDEFEEEIE